MYDRTVAIPTQAGQMETFITHPEEGGPFPAVVIYMDFWGVREELFDIARRVGTVDYYCMVPDLYYRQGRVRHQWRNDKNQMISMHNLDPERQREAMVPLEKLSNAMVIEDTRSLIAFMDRGEPVRPGGIGSMGYCMGGRHVLCVAVAYPDRFGRQPPWHGAYFRSRRFPASARAPVSRRDLLRLCRTRSSRASDNDTRTRRPSEPLPVAYRHELHPGAEHGYALPNRDIHDKRAANRDWELIFAMFRRQLPFD